MNQQLPRRTFLKQTALIGAAAVFSARSRGQVAGANGDIRVAVCGLNGRGKSHINSLKQIKGVRIVAFCDPDSSLFEPSKKLAGATGDSIKTYTDIRQLLASPDVDAITIAMPNHWHSLAGIWACQAGKDVYVEKPISHNVWEGTQLVAAATKYNRVMQTGTQIRSGQGLIDAVAWVKAGNIGKITASRGFCYKRRDSIGKTSGPQAVPASINYDLWTGPAALVAPHRNSAKNGPVHYDWHWINLYGNGDIGNQGIHQMDVARWFLGETGLPRHTMSIGGRLGYVDDGETPNTQVIIHDYATAPLIFEVRGLPSKPTPPPANAANMSSADIADAQGAVMDKYRGVSIGNVVDCEGGYVVTNSYFNAQAYDKSGKQIKSFEGKDRQMQNFIDVVRSRKNTELYGPIGEGHYSSALCHLGNISHLLGRSQPPGAISEQIKGDAKLSEAYGRMAEHLGTNGVNLDRTPLTLGVPLAFDPASERFTGQNAAGANALLTAEYRQPFVVPTIA